VSYSKGRISRVARKVGGLPTFPFGEVGEPSDCILNVVLTMLDMH